MRGKLTHIEGRKLTFSMDAHDGIDKISVGTHQRFVIDTEKFNRKAEEKRRALLGD